ncbi:MAG: formylglycine-generating enzyme family protein [Desulfococcaceae bacterium]
MQTHYPKSLSKRGFVQKELKLALDILGEFSDEDVFLIPARVDDCQTEDERLKYLNWADLFPSYEAGRDEIMRVFQYAASEKTEESDEPAVIASVKSENKRSESVIASVSEPEKEFTNSLGMKFVYIPPGTFMMGSPEDEPERSENEILHKVTLTKGFYMQITQVTQKQWKAVMGNNPSYFKNCDDCPVEQVSWDDVQEFMKKLNGIEKKELYHLPTEAQWEYACRAGSDKPYCFGDSVEKLKKYAWHSENSGRKTHSVAQLASNAWGLYDMHGNVWEWCQDWYGPYSSAAATDPVGAASGPLRVYRGGRWGFPALCCRSAYRSGGHPAYRSDGLGFRVQRS